MRTPQAATDPWGTEIDNGWKDLVVSSAPPPPPREAMESSVKNRSLPADFNTWQEHGAARPAVEEPSFSAGDRRMWLVAGTLMGLAVLVLGALGLLTFGNVSATSEAAEAPRAAAVVGPARTLKPTRPSVASHPAAIVASNGARTSKAARASTNPRLLKSSSRASRSRHHKRIAAR